jgi:TonB-dependent starch-binding outer membrane protein SusC
MGVERCCMMIGAFALMFFTVPSVAFAQERGSVRGTVVEAATQRPLAGVQVTVVGTQLGTSTNAEGRFLIGGVPTGTQQIRIRSIGYGADTKTVNVVSGAVASVDFTLNIAAVALDELVVTGTAGQARRREQAAVIATVDAASLVQVAPISTVGNLLTGRTPGVSVSHHSGSSGTAQRIRLRGSASINLSNEPLIFVDGVRFNGNVQQVWFAGGQAGSRLNDINPADIESIEIVKGPAAASLYGADASAGVIQIITKKGRAGTGFRQNISVQYGHLDPNYAPPMNWATCTQQAINAGNPNCQGLAPGTTISDSPTLRYDVFRNGQSRSINYNGRGGGTDYGYYVSLGVDDEDGVTVSNSYNRYSGQLNFNFIPTPDLRIDAGFGLNRVDTRLPINDNNIYGYMFGILMGSPLTVGQAQDGWFGVNRQMEAISSIRNSNTALRVLPRISATHQITPWFTNRLTVGADIGTTEAALMYPLNRNNWYGDVEFNSGRVWQSRIRRNEYTVDYLGTIRRQLTESVGSDLSFGVQTLVTQIDNTTAEGFGFTTSATNSISAAAQSTGNQSSSEERQVGILAQWKPSWKDQLFLQFTGRVDRTSTFGRDVGWFLSPAVGVSWVVNEAPFWPTPGLPVLSTLRLRTVYGTTGRSPGSGALTTYASAPFAVAANDVQSGVLPSNPGNPDLRPERGQELELGADIGLFAERVGLEVTYFDKRSRDVIMAQPIPASLGFTQNPLVNVGEVRNRGFELGASARVIEADRVRWDVRMGLNTLDNKVVDLGDIAPIGPFIRILPGYQVDARFTRVVREIDLERNRAVVSDTAEFVGNFMPSLEWNLSSTITLLNNLRVYGALDAKRNFLVLNFTDEYRERQVGTGERWVRRNDILTPEERIRRFGPFINERTGANVPAAQVQGEYLEDGSFVRLQELSIGYTLGPALARHLRAQDASITLSGRNLGLWTNYTGPDPEVIANNNLRTARTDFATLPPVRRWALNVRLQF